MPPLRLVFSARPPIHRSTSSRPVVEPFASSAHAPLENRKSLASAGGTSAGAMTFPLPSSCAGCGSTIARAAARREASVGAALSAVVDQSPSGPAVLHRIVGCLPYAATKFTSDDGCLMCWPKSAQLVYGISWLSPVLPYSSRRNGLSRGTPASRARVRLRVARSSGRPSRLFRSTCVTNSSISLPVWSDEPMTMAPAAASGV